MKAKIPSRIQIAATRTLNMVPSSKDDSVEIDSLSEDFVKDGLTVDDVLIKKGSRKVEFLVSWDLPFSFDGFKIVNLEAMKREQMKPMATRYQLKTKKWPWPCICRGGAKKGQPTIRTVRPHISKNEKYYTMWKGRRRTVVVPEVHCGKCTLCGQLWYSVAADADIVAATKAQIRHLGKGN